LTFLENADRVLVATFFLPVTIEFSRPVPEPQPFEGNPQARGRRKANSDVQDNFFTAFSPAAYLLGRDEPISESSAPRDRTPSFTSAAAAKPPSADFKTGEEPADFKILPATMGNIGLKNAVNSIPQLKAKSLWVGTLSGVSTEMTSKGTMHAINSRWSAEASSIPVLLADETYHLAYEVFAKTVLWKVLHYEINDVPRGQAFDLAAWEAYVEVNRQFASVIAANTLRGP
jgi:trehalose-6-phosphate synthase